MTVTIPQLHRALAYVERAEGDADNVFRFRASSAAIARDGLAIPASAWDFTHFLNNPVVMLSHGFGPAQDVPIGHAQDIQRDDMGLIAEVNFDPDDPHAQSVMRKLRRRDLNAVSVGFRILSITDKDGNPVEGFFMPEGAIVTKAELLEISVVSVPADPHALLMRSMWSAIDPALAGIGPELRKLMTTLEVAPAEPETNPTQPEERLVDLLAAVRNRIRTLGRDGLDDDDWRAIDRTVETFAALVGDETDDDELVDESLDIESLPLALRGLLNDDRNA